MEVCVPVMDTDDDDDDDIRVCRVYRLLAPHCLQ